MSLSDSEEAEQRAFEEVFILEVIGESEEDDLEQLKVVWESSHECKRVLSLNTHRAQHDRLHLS